MSEDRRSEILDARDEPLAELQNHLASTLRDVGELWNRVGVPPSEGADLVTPFLAHVASFHQASVRLETDVNERIGASMGRFESLQARLGIDATKPSAAVSRRAMLMGLEQRNDELRADCCRNARVLALVDEWSKTVQAGDFAVQHRPSPSCSLVVDVDAITDLSAATIDARANSLLSVLQAKHGSVDSDISEAQSELAALWPAYISKAADLPGALTPTRNTFVHNEGVAVASCDRDACEARFATEMANAEAAMAASMQSDAVALQALPPSVRALYAVPSPLPQLAAATRHADEVRGMMHNAMLALLDATVETLRGVYATILDKTENPCFANLPARLTDSIAMARNTIVASAERCHLIDSAAALIEAEIAAARAHHERVVEILPLLEHHASLRSRKDFNAKSAKEALMSRSTNSANVLRDRAQVEKDLPEAEAKILAVLSTLEVAPFDTFVFKGVELRASLAPSSPVPRVRNATTVHRTPTPPPVNVSVTASVVKSTAKRARARASPTPTPKPSVDRNLQFAE
jgi:hypothetical protein